MDPGLMRTEGVLTIRPREILCIGEKRFVLLLSEAA